MIQRDKLLHQIGNASTLIVLAFVIVFAITGVPFLYGIWYVLPFFVLGIISLIMLSLSKNKRRIKK